tara:strand:- start:305 stop:619 length:315 start_codon:yes stop_codon:yes gene_type:complete
MEWINILKRSKHHTSRKFRRGRLHPADRTFPKRGVPMVGAMHDSKAEARKDKPMPDYEQELADVTKEDLIEMLTEQVQDMPREDIINLLVRTKGELEDIKLTEE